MSESITGVMAIDTHAHYGTYYVEGATEEQNRFMGGDGKIVAVRAHRARTQYTVVSPLSGLFPRGQADAVAGNEEAERVVAATPELLQWVIVHPLQKKTFEQARRLLALPQCVGIKIHPEEHQYPIAEHGHVLFEFAAEQKAAILAHSGDELSKPMDFVPFANAFPEVSVIVAHLGNGGKAGGDPTLQVRAIQMAKYGNMFTDTSSARSILPGLIEWAVKEIGVEHVLYGTDSPLYFAPSQRARIDHADLTTPEKRAILRENAIRILDLSVEEGRT